MGSDREGQAKTRRGRGGALQTTSNVFGRERRGEVNPKMEGVNLGADTVDRLHAHGYALVIGRTRDGGAVSITLLDGDERHRTYCATQEELNEAFDTLRELTIDSPK